MLLLILIILFNLAVTILGMRAMRSQAEAEKFLYVPALIRQGRNFRGYVLSHFAHSGWAHFLFNMLALYMFAVPILKASSYLSLALIYLLSGLAVDLIIFVLRSGNPGYRCLGASGSVSGIVFAGIVYDPHMSVFFFLLPIPIPGPIFALLYIALSIYLMRHGQDNISHEAHIGGSLAGFVGAALLSPEGIGPLWQRILELAAGVVK